MNISHLFIGVKNDSRKRVGRGIAGSGGKTAGRGTKGQNARSGSGRKVQDWFEGGQTPLYRKLAKSRGRIGRLTTKDLTITTDVLNRKFQDGETVSPTTLVEKKVLRRLTPHQQIKIVLRSPLKAKLKFSDVKKSASFGE